MKKPTLFKSTLLSGLLSVCVAAPASAEDHIYLMTKQKVRNTTFTRVAFLSDRLIGSMEECEKERQWGYSGKWRFLGHKMKRLSGHSVQVNYFCVKTPREFTKWSAGDEYRDVFLIRYEEDQVKLIKQSSYSKCMTAMRKIQSRESGRLFCARINQEFKS